MFVLVAFKRLLVGELLPALDADEAAHLIIELNLLFLHLLFPGLHVGLDVPLVMPVAGELLGTVRTLLGETLLAVVASPALVELVPVVLVSGEHVLGQLVNLLLTVRALILLLPIGCGHPFERFLLPWSIIIVITAIITLIDTTSTLVGHLFITVVILSTIKLENITGAEGARGLKT